MRHIVDAVQVAGALLVEHVLRHAAHDLQRIGPVEQLTRFAAQIDGGWGFGWILPIDAPTNFARATLTRCADCAA